VLAPALRAEYGLTLPQIGVILAAPGLGGLATVFLWGLASDRFGERSTIVLGLGATGLCIAGMALASGFVLLVVLVFLAGAAGWSVSSGTARAVMHWFSPDERGFALGVRQASVPIAGLISALALPAIDAAAGLDVTLFVLAGLCWTGALAAGVFIRENRGVHVGHGETPSPLALSDPRLWRLGIASGLYIFPQAVMMGFVVLFLHDARELSVAAAAAALGAVNILGATLRIAVGRWSDRRGLRVVPLRQIGLATCATIVAVALFATAPVIVLLPLLIAAGGLSMAWNGLAMTAVTELGGRDRSGAAIGVQQTVMAVSVVASSIVFAATVDATSWRVAFTVAGLVVLGGWWILAPLAEQRQARA
jgi:sugar phosphate permease